MQEPGVSEPRGELGTWLQEAREAQGLSLDEVEAQTRIRRTFLEALEEGNYRILPGEVYVRGFLRNYAVHLGLDPEGIRRRYREEVLDQQVPQSTQSFSDFQFQPIDADLERTDRAISTLVTRIALILLLLIGVTGVTIWYRYGCPLPQAPAWWPPSLYSMLATATSSQGLTSSAPPPTVTSALIPPSVTMTPATSLPILTPPAKAVATSEVLPLPTPTSVATATSTPTPSPVITPTGGEGIQLTIRAIERSWVLITTDDTVDFQGILRVGEELTWQADHSVGFRCGNAGGVAVTINGQELGVLGERGQVVDQTWIVQENQIIVATSSSP
jgi:cytoskeleton protein RodZ